MLVMPEQTQQKIALLLMAAGSSSRLGQPKQWVKVIDAKNSSQSLLHRQVGLMNEVCNAINAKACCVLGFESDAMITHLADCASAQHLTIIDNANWPQVLSHSIATGVSLISQDTDAVMIFLVDQWQLSLGNLTELITQWQKEPECIHIAGFNNDFSPPVIFPRHFFKELMLLQGDEGAKQVIKDNIKQVKSLDMPAAFVDLDTPEQLNDMKNNTNLLVKLRNRAC